MYGNRVVRGPDWKWNGQDGGLGHIGTVLDFDTERLTAYVCWDMGVESHYRIGAEQAYDLRIYDNGQCGIKHEGVTCSGCSENGITGIRWKCRDCPTINLCTKCYMDDIHDRCHPFLRQTAPGVPMRELKTRSGTKKLESHGIFQGSTVYPGRDWKYDDHGVSKDAYGRVQQVKPWMGMGERNAVAVKWVTTGNTDDYRLGFEGRVDVTCRGSMTAGAFYSEHLPVLGDPNEMAILLQHKTSRPREPQQSSAPAVIGASVATPRPSAARTASVPSTALTDVVVRPVDTSRPPATSMSSTVSSLPATTASSSAPATTASSSAPATTASSSAPATTASSRAPAATASSRAPAATASSCAPSPATSSAPSPTTSSQPTAGAVANVPSSSGGSSEQFVAGERVKIELPVELLEDMQSGHGGWAPAMAEAIGEVGTVSRITPEGDVVVEYTNGKKWIFNPAALVKVSSSQQPISVGSTVRVINDLEHVRSLQAGHGEWVDDMRALLGGTGQVVQVYPTGDLRVAMVGRVWTLNPAACVPAPEGSAPGGVVSGREVGGALAGLQQLEALARSAAEGTGLLSMLMQGLLEAGGGSGLGDAMGLISAAKDGNGSVVKKILEKSPNLVNEKAFDVGALHVASNEGHMEVVRLLLNHKADVMLKDKEGNTALHHCAMGGKSKVMEVLLKHGAAVNDRNEKGRTALHFAADRHNLDCVKVLVGHPCNVNVQDRAGNTALHVAVAGSDMKVIATLAEHECANPSLTNEEGFNVLHYAALKGNAEATRKILSVSPQLCEQKTLAGLTPLHVAASHGQSSVIDVLVEHGKADIEARTERQQTPLLLAVFDGHKNAAECLVEFGADLSSRDAAGNTCLHYAVEAWVNQEADNPGENSAEHLVQYLLKNGADVSCVNTENKSPLDKASHPRIRQLLSDYVVKNTSDVVLPTCVLCCDLPATVTFRPCGHSIVCSECSVRIKKCNACHAAIESKDTSGTGHRNGVPAVPFPHPGGDDSTRVEDPGEMRQRLMQLEKETTCPICLTHRRNIIFNCGHTVCKTCSHSLTECHLCRAKVVSRSPFFI